MKKSKSKRQSSWQLRMAKSNRCRRCGQPRGKSPYSGVCLGCADKRREEQRRYRNGGAWKPGGLGRTPLTAKK